MKKISLLLLPLVAILLATSCKDKSAYTVKGKIDKKYDGTQVYLQKLNDDGSGFVSSDTVTIKNGAFNISGTSQGEPAVRFISVANNEVRPALVIIEPGEINVTIDTIPTVGGTALNDSYQEFSNKTNTLAKKLASLEQEYKTASVQGTLTPDLEAKIDNEYDITSDELSNQIYEFIKTNAKNSVGEFFFLSAANNLSPEQLKVLLAELRPEFKKDEKIQKLEEHLSLLEKTEVGKPYINVSGQTTDGKEVSLSDYVGKGKYILIDFWASWCNPCLKEMPNLVKDYNEYKNKGFEIVGISLDNSKEAWIAESKKSGVVWPQFSDLGGWQSPAAAAYGVRSIPFTLLLNKEGTIIAKNLRGKELSDKLAELMP